MNCEIFDYAKPIIVATSKWIEQEARKSLLSTRTDIKMIYDWIADGIRSGRMKAGERIPSENELGRQFRGVLWLPCCRDPRSGRKTAKRTENQELWGAVFHRYGAGSAWSAISRLR